MHYVMSFWNVYYKINLILFISVKKNCLKKKILFLKKCTCSLKLKKLLG